MTAEVVISSSDDEVLFPRGFRRGLDLFGTICISGSASFSSHRERFLSTGAGDDG